MPVLMPQGVTRPCSHNDRCGYSAFTVHTGHIPCGCGGHLLWPHQWPHVCSRGHGHMVAVAYDDSGSPTVSPVMCPTCEPLAVP